MGCRGLESHAQGRLHIQDTSSMGTVMRKCVINMEERNMGTIHEENPQTRPN